ncbi:hypothetical protein B0T16DRAFT_402505 [Cercophora newfieldiana]|uniref:Uncharacterized protein n=1 Tax=Cercophora newfieldiana TaxID=92897 RepID=A0AA39YSG4_9PEZI|nr:hypothetical protein B0T16DRAFT_402505 [Cercophora newfieldiana]
MADQLRNMVTPTLLHDVRKIVFPFSETEPLDFTVVSHTGFGGGGSPTLPDKVRKQVWPFLVALSRLGLDNAPDMTTFLPVPSDPDFARQAMGLQLLLDQMPRRLCRGVDCRWTNVYFDIISLKYAQKLDALPEDQKPWSWAQWKDCSTLDYWILARTTFVVPFTHRDSIETQERSLEFSEETRKTIEDMTGTKDPYRARRGEILSDIYGFPRVIRDGPPKENVTIQDYTYWVFMLMDVHKPLVDAFGRYPYRNAYFGRDDTPDEVEWFEKTGDFARPPKDARDRLKADFEAGTWTPLDEGLHM